MSSVYILVPGQPQSWTRTGGRTIITPGQKAVHVRYTPKEQRAYMDRVATFGMDAMREEGHDKPFDEPVMLTATQWFGLAQGKYRKRDPVRMEPARNSKDVDNGLKNLMDALTGIVWTDDCLVVRVMIDKWMCGQQDNRPRTELYVHVVLPEMWMRLHPGLKGDPRSDFIAPSNTPFLDLVKRMEHDKA